MGAFLPLPRLLLLYNFEKLVLQGKPNSIGEYNGMLFDLPDIDTEPDLCHYMHLCVIITLTTVENIFEGSKVSICIEDVC